MSLATAQVDPAVQYAAGVAAPRVTVGRGLSFSRRWDGFVLNKDVRHPVPHVAVGLHVLQGVVHGLGRLLGDEPDYPLD